MDDIKKPRRRIVVDLKIEGDDWRDIRSVLHCLETELACSGTFSTSCVSGGYSSGYTLTSNEDETITHESWETTLNKYLDSIDE